MNAPRPVPAEVERRLAELHAQCLTADSERVVNYYDSARGYYPPESAGAERDRFAISLVSVDAHMFGVGDDRHLFPLHSISKVFTYGLALADNGREAVLRRVGVDPSGDAFNSIVFDERHHRPHNPMVNAGALVTADLVQGSSAAEKSRRLVDMLRRYSGNDSLQVDGPTYAHEIRGADHNRAAAYLMRSEGMFDGDVEELIGLYLQQCSVQVTCRDLAVMAATIANGCVNPLTGQRTLPRERVRDLLSVMFTCGMYDAAGQWAYDVGVPAKSGVGGGILAVVPGKFGLAVYSPGLDEYGNSVRGIRVCEEVSDRLGLHVFATEDEDVLGMSAG